MAVGEIDIAYRQLLPTAVNAFKTDVNVKVWEGVGAQIQYMCFQERIPPFNNVNVRKAITACLNRTEVCNTVFLRTAQPLYSIIPNGLAYHKDSFLKYGSANYTYAKALLSPLGYNASNKLTVDLWYESSGHYPSSSNQALVYESELEASGVISVTLHSATWATYRLNRDHATMPMFAYGWYPDYVDADDYAFLPFASWLNMGYNQTYPTGGVQQYGYWLAGRSAATDAARYGNYTILQDLQASEISMIPLWQKSNAVVTRLSVSGVSLDITARLYLSLLTMDLSTATTTTTTTTTTTSTSTTGTTGNTSESWGLISTVVTFASIAVIVVFAIAIVCKRR
jgi:peptide/nickel transport system substrate-binding protein